MGRADAREAEARDDQSADRVEPDVIAGRDDLDDDRRRIRSTAARTGRDRARAHIVPAATTENAVWALGIAA